MNSEYEKQLGQKIKEIRCNRNLTQEQLSAKLQVLGCNVTRSALAKIEVGQRHIYPFEMKAIKQALNISYDNLLE